MTHWRRKSATSGAAVQIQQLLIRVDAISVWVGKAAAWLIIGLMTLVCV